MAVDVPTFKARFPEFVDAPDALVQAKLNDSLTLTPAAVWGDNTIDNSIAQQGAFYYCARFLALSPYARKLALVAKDGTTQYDRELFRLRSIVTSGLRMS